jgi:hypothetical protein
MNGLPSGARGAAQAFGGRAVGREAHPRRAWHAGAPGDRA